MSLVQLDKNHVQSYRQKDCDKKSQIFGWDQIEKVIKV